MLALAVQVDLYTYVRYPVLLVFGSVLALAVHAGLCVCVVLKWGAPKSSSWSCMALDLSRACAEFLFVRSRAM